MHSLTSMLKYKRKHGTESIKDFCSRFLHPTFGYPDKNGNYELVIGDNPSVCYAAHYDSVHKDNGMQNIQINEGIVSLANGSKSNCLGADCATGIWLILEMIDAGIEGVYVVHAEEETGCIGSRALVEDNPWWLASVNAVISFDRKGTSDIITHQMGCRTASDAFAKSLASILGMDHEPDPTGSYTDSNEYAHLIPECTNLAVGYYSQHTAKETQDLNYVARLRDALISADWSKLVIARDPAILEYHYDDHWGYPLRGTPSGYTDSVVGEDSVADFYDVILEHPEALARLLADYWTTTAALEEDLYAYGAQINLNKYGRL